MLSRNRRQTLRRLTACAVIMTSCLFGVLGSACEMGTRYFDPCGTIFTCAPGSFGLQFADGVGDWNVDPTCTIPGGCVDEGDVWQDPYSQLGPGFVPGP